MPQDPNDWVSIDKLNPPNPGAGINDWQPINTSIPQQQQPQAPTKEPTWFDTGVTGLARYVAPVAVPMAASLFTEGLALPWSMALGSGTAAAGEGAAEWYEKQRGLRNEYNPTQIGIAGAVGAFPGVGKPAKTILGAAAKGATEGYGLGFATSFPQTYLEQGRMPTFSEANQSGEGGALFGGLGGGIVHGAHGLLKGKPTVTPSSEVPPTEIPPTTSQAKPVSVKDIPGITFEPNPPAGHEVITVQSADPTVGDQLRSEGFKPRKGYRGKGNLPQMIRPVPSDVPEQYASQGPGDFVPTDTQPHAPGETMPPSNRIPYHENDGFWIPSEQVDKPTIDTYAKQGYHPNEVDEDGNIRMKFYDKPPAPLISFDEPPGISQTTNQTPRQAMFTQDPMIPSGSVGELRARNQLDQISNAPQESVDLGGQPGMESFGPRGISEAFGIGKKSKPLPQSEPLHQTPGEEMVGMQLGNREDILRNQRGQYAEHGARVANKELLQNAIDALTNPDGTGISGGQVKVTLDHHSTPKSITVEDNGPGIPYEALKNEYITLTGSGKRGKGKFIGEMGVGKATYLLGAESFDITSTVKEANGQTWEYNIKGNPEDMIKGTTKLTKRQVADKTPTGTKAIIHETEATNMEAARNYLRNFSKYSNTPVDVVLKDNKETDRYLQHRNINETVPARNVGTSQFVGAGSAPGGDYKISIPDNAKWNDKQGTTMAILSNRGMFQGAETVYPHGYGSLPDRVLVEIDPTVDAQNSKYPLTSPTRERMKDEFKTAITKEIDEKIMKASRDRQQQDLKTSYDNLIPHPTLKGADFVVHDSGEQYTPQELEKLNNSPRVQAVMRTMNKTLNDLDLLFPTEQIGGKTTKYGMLVASTDKGGVNVPNPGSSGENAVLVNILGSMEGRTPKQAAQRIVHLIMHEFNHNLARTEGGDFTWKLAETHTRFDLERQVDAKKAILAAITDSSGNYAPEIQDLLQEYKDSRGRPNPKEDLLYRSATGGLFAADRQAGVPSSSQADGEGTTGISDARKPPVPGGKPTILANKQKPPSTLREAYNLARGATSTADLSAAFRQGLGLITRKEWWTSWKQQVAALGSEAAYQKSIADIKARPLFESYTDPVTKKAVKSWSEKAGLKVMEDVQDINSKEEATASNWIETGGMFGKDNPVQKGYQGSFGRIARASNRAYIAFLNQLRADTWESLMKDAFRDFQSGAKGGRNPYTDLPFAKEIADYVNTATGRGPMRLARPTIEGGRLGLKESNFEYASRVLTDTLFSPRLIFSRLRMLNPATYAMASPFVRKQYLRSALGIAGAWTTVAGLAKLAGADVSLDSDSADFGKVKIGNNVRLDPMGGFQQYYVALHRLISGRYVSSASGTESELGQGYRAETGLDVLHQFGANKLHPVLKFAHDLLNASTHQPFSYMDRTAQLFVPLIVGDVVDLAKEDPSLLPLAIPTAMGMGTQVYEKGETQNKFIPPEHDFTTTHGISDLNPANWGQQDGSLR